MNALTIPRAEFAEALAVAARVAKNEAWKELRLQSAAGHLVISATDLEHWLDLSLPCSGELPPVCVHAQRLHDVIASMIGELVGLQIEGSQLRIFAGRGKRALATMPAEGWQTREFSPVVTVTLEADRLRSAFKFTLPNIAPVSDLNKAALAGVHLYTDGGHLKAAGCDSFNLTIVDLGECRKTIGATVSPISVDIVDRLASGPIEASFNERGSEFRWSGGVIRGPLIAGDYPVHIIAKLLKTEFTSSMTTGADELLAAVRSVRAVGYRDVSTKSTGVRMTLNGTATLSTSSQEGSAEQEFIIGDYDGEGEFQIGFASGRMERLLNCFGDSVLTVSFREPRDPMKFEAAAVADRVALLFPMQI